MSGLVALLLLVVVPLLLGLLAARAGVDSRDSRWSLTSRDEARGPVSRPADRPAHRPVHRPAH